MRSSAAGSGSAAAGAGSAAAGGTPSAAANAPSPPPPADAVAPCFASRLAAPSALFLASAAPRPPAAAPGARRWPAERLILRENILVDALCL